MAIDEPYSHPDQECKPTEPVKPFRHSLVLLTFNNTLNSLPVCGLLDARVIKRYPRINGIGSIGVPKGFTRQYLPLLHGQWCHLTSLPRLPMIAAQSPALAFVSFVFRFHRAPFGRDLVASHSPDFVHRAVDRMWIVAVLSA